MTVKDIKNFLENKPDDADVKISFNGNELPGEQVCGLYYGEGSTGEQDADENDIIKCTVVFSSYVHF